MDSVGGEEAIQEPTDHDERILVSVRLRPLNEKELARNDVSDWECINDTTIIYRSNLSATDRSLYPTAYSFDSVFRTDSSTRQVYEKAAKEVALSVVGGINSSIFAYGQTSSGKTYTMSGITEYTVADIFNYIEKHTEREFMLKFSAIEIYNESVRDLLSPDCTPLRLLDDPERGTVVERLTEETLGDWNHFTELISFCEAQRQIGETALNEASSRSHQILRLTIESSAREFLGNDKSSSLSASVNFVDLAGSERASQTHSAGTRLKEGCHINRSLLTLGTVIRKLRDLGLRESLRRTRKELPSPFRPQSQFSVAETTVTAITAVTTTDLDRAIIGFMPPSPPHSSANIFFASHSCSGVEPTPSCLLLFCDLNIDQNDLAERLPSFSRRRVPRAVEIRKPISAATATAREP
ncbi:Kinesin-like protein KIN-7G [Glycine max]|nr:Kinesin-like protein KIN-7G [Glycine max]